VTAPSPAGGAAAAHERVVPPWHLRGHVIVACNCDYGCPCNFNGLPSMGKCEGNWNWHVEQGSFGDEPLSGLNFGVAVNWPGPIHEGNGEAIVVIDERADDRQRGAIETLIAGGAGGPWKIISTTIATMHGPEYVPFEISVSGLASSVRAGSHIVIEMEPVRNRKTGAETHPRAILPEGFVFKEAELGASRTFRISGPVSFDHSGRYAAAAPFDYCGP
jgi:hypothetical protein